MYVYAINKTDETEYLYAENNLFVHGEKIGFIINSFLDDVGYRSFIIPDISSEYNFDANPYYIELTHHLIHYDSPILYNKDSFSILSNNGFFEPVELNDLLNKLRISIEEERHYTSLTEKLIWRNSIDAQLAEKLYYFCYENNIFCSPPALDNYSFSMSEILHHCTNTEDVTTFPHPPLPKSNDILMLLNSQLVRSPRTYHELFVYILTELPITSYSSLDNDLDRIEPIISTTLYEEMDEIEYPLFCESDGDIVFEDSTYWATIDEYAFELSSKYGENLFPLFRMLLMLYHPDSNYEHPFWNNIPNYTHNLDMFCRKYFKFEHAPNTLRKCIENSFIINENKKVKIYVCDTLYELLQTSVFVCHLNKHTLQKCAFSHPKCDNYFFKKTRQIYCPYCTEKAKKYADAHPKDQFKRVLDNYKKNRQRLINNITNVKLYHKEISEGNYLEYITDVLHLLYLSQRPEQLNGSDLEFRIALSNDDIALELKKKKIQCIIQTSNKKLKLFDEPEDGSKPYILLDYSSKDIITNSWTCEDNSVSIIQEKVTWGELYKRSDEGTKNYIRTYTQKLLIFYSKRKSTTKLNIPLSFKALANTIGVIDGTAIPEDWKDIHPLHNTSSKKNTR